MSRINFASDNAVGVDRKLAEFFVQELSMAEPYGGDQATREFESAVRQCFGATASGFLVFNGTGANVLSLAALVKPYQRVFVAESSHLYLDECGAFERFTGARLTPLSHLHGKLSVKELHRALEAYPEGTHHGQWGAISITQPTEWGVCYTPDEILEISQLAHANRMVLHMDGARLSNAAVFLNRSLTEITTELGVDVVSFGGTKNGLPFGEAVVFLRGTPDGFEFVRKQGMQLASKMQFMSRPFARYLGLGLWKELATHANTQAKALEEGLKSISWCSVVAPVQANGVFVKIPKLVRERLLKDFFFYEWDSSQDVVRLMCTFKTSPSDVSRFLECVRREGG